MIALAMMAAAAPLAGFGDAMKDATGQRPCRAQAADEIVVCARPGESPYRYRRLPGDVPSAAPARGANAAAERDALAGPGPVDCTRVHAGCGGTVPVLPILGKVVQGVGKIVERVRERDD